MKIHQIDLASKVEKNFFYLAIGNFDGVHLGHQKIIKQLISESHIENKPAAILSFEPHPRQYFSHDLDRYQIIGEEKKNKILASLGIDDLFYLKFDISIAELSAADFIKKIILQKLQVRKLFVGYDFKFGKKREGDTLLLKDYASIHGFDLSVIDPIKDSFNSEAYSSSSIREAIKNGNIEKANRLLGHQWSMDGEVVHGDKKARQMNFPTANLLPHAQIYPLKGVYVINAVINKSKYKGIANFGERPTVKGANLLLETHIFDFNRDIYGKELTVEFLTFIRSEKKFKDFKSLTTQIKKDVITAKKYHKI